MIVTEIMSSAARMVGPETDLLTAARLMKAYDIGCLLVGANRCVAGIVTDRDMVLRGMTTGNHVSDLTVAEVMTRDPMFCMLDDTVMQAARIMADNQVRRLPVLNADRSLAGIVSLGDICTHSPRNLAGELIEEVSKPLRHELVGKT